MNGSLTKLPQIFGKSFTYFILCAWTLFLVVSAGWIVTASLSTTPEIFSNKLLASGFHFENYTKALTTYNLGLYFLNSVIYVFVSIALVLLISAPAAYVLSRMEFRGRKPITFAFVAGMGIPEAMTLVPLFILFLRLNLMNTAAGLIIIYVCTSIPFTVYFLTAFFASLPTELEEAALIDGATRFQAFWMIMLPLAQPGLITVAIFRFLGLWNEYFWALIFVNSDARRTLVLGLEAIMRAMRYTGDYGGVFASIMIVFLPTFLIYIFVSERIISGVTAGAVKS